jgi:hypothetical protein
VTRWTLIAILALFSACAEIREAAARGRHSNFGPWDVHSQALPLDTRAPRRNEGRVAKKPPLTAATHRPRHR